MNYIADMKLRTSEAFAQLHAGVTQLEFTDYPDYANVGDTAIALGQWAYWDSKGIRVTRASSVPTLRNSTFNSEIPVLINGGGNLGGLYPGISEHRYRLAENLATETLLIQAPQSVHFPAKGDCEEFARRMGSRTQLRVAVRDQPSFDALKPYVANLIMSPDAVHLLGAIDAPASTQKTFVLRRGDKESASMDLSANGVDWPADPIDLRLNRWLSWRTKQIPAIKPAFQRPPAILRKRAQRRMQRGVRLLSQGETIVTDRLHAMLLGLQMGRRVVAYDNNNGKLTAYANAWLSDAPQLELRHGLLPSSVEVSR